jgi:hypothetical protein
MERLLQRLGKKAKQPLRALIMKYHPDRNPGVDVSREWKVVSEFKELFDKEARPLRGEGAADPAPAPTPEPPEPAPPPAPVVEAPPPKKDESPPVKPRGRRKGKGPAAD